MSTLRHLTYGKQVNIYGKLNPALFYFMKRTPIPKFYQVHEGRKDYVNNRVRVLPVHNFCKELALV